MESLPGYKECFVCGKDNPIGLNLNIYRENKIVKAEFIPDSRHQGFPGIVHGGIIFSILDELMGRTAVINKGVLTLTVEIKIKYRKKAQLGKKIIFNAYMVKDKGKIIETEAQARLEDGTLLAEAWGKFFVIPPNKQREMERLLI
ncbi:MAG: PaaI family thioesterase [Candidatus Caldatribacteriota bacterium]